MQREGGLNNKETLLWEGDASTINRDRRSKDKD